MYVHVPLFMKLYMPYKLVLFPRLNFSVSDIAKKSFQRSAQGVSHSLWSLRMFRGLYVAVTYITDSPSINILGVFISPLPGLLGKI